MRDPLPYEAGFLAGKAFLAYKKRGGVKRPPMPAFYRMAADDTVANAAAIIGVLATGCWVSVVKAMQVRHRVSRAGGALEPARRVQGASMGH